MRKFFVIVIVLVVGVKYGTEYLFSPKFQKYADESKAPWTCQLENFFGQMCMVMSHYRQAQTYFSRTAERCPGSSMAEAAEYGIAESLEKQGLVRQAAQAYDAFAEKYKGTKRARTAIRASQVMNNS